MTIEIVNTHVVGQSVGEYCGRGSPLGNPIPISSESGRNFVCDQYESIFAGWVRTRTEPQMSELFRLKRLYEDNGGSLTLRCFCAPKRCHVETIRDWLEASAFSDDSSY